MRIFRAAAMAAALACVAIPAAAQKTLNVGVSIFTGTLSPAGGGYTTLSLVLLTSDGLVQRQADDTLKPGLAERWETVSPTEWRFHLRRGVKFHDGTEMTAADVKYTLDYVLDPKTVYVRKTRIAGIAKVDIVDPYTVAITTKQPYPVLLRGLSEIPIEPKVYREAVGIDGYAKKPIGTGPFKFVKLVPGDTYELEANKDYWAGAPRFDKLVLRQIPEGATRVAALIAGEVQIIEEVPVDLIPSVQRRRELEIVSVPSSVSLVMTMNQLEPPLDNPKVREALDIAIDREQINKLMLDGRGEILQGQLVTKGTFGFNPALKPRAFDPARAKKLLAEAGHAGGLDLTLITQNGRYLSDTDIANAVAGMWQNIGARVTVNTIEGAVWTRMDRNRELKPIYMVGWFSVGDADFNTVWYTQASNRAYWKNDEFEKLFAAARSTIDEKQRLAHYARMMQIMHDELPSVFLFGVPRVYGKSRKVKGWEPSSDSLLRLSTLELE
ncbi:MAG: ABC transporter substrate-binding protein [Alphaproteobacteria bacterium]